VCRRSPGWGKRGHEVRVLVRSPEAEARVRGMGAEPVRLSLFDRAAVTAAVRGADAVLHLATRIAPAAAARRRRLDRERPPAG